MIRKLPPHLVQQIAAGEVIERPASVLKELIENSIDAGASTIDVSIRKGGLESIRVEDDGSGIDENELPLALEAHATSKLASVEDLERIRSLGFRGEALASMSAVSELILQTSTRNAKRGAELRSLYGNFAKIEAIDKRTGTSVEVRGLFQKVPARLKFLKSERSEAMALSQVFRRYALAFPEKRWTYLDQSSNRKVNLPQATAFDRSLWYFDATEPSEWFEERAEGSGWKIHIIALWPRHRGQARSGFQIFLNQRPLRDLKLEAALRRGFEGFTEFPREMSATLFVEGSPDQFDVNVHPTKMEVRFLNPDPLFSLIVETLRKRLQREHHDLFQLPSSAETLERRPYQMPWVEPSASTISASESLEASELKTRLFEGQSEFEFWFAIDQTFLVCRRGQELILFDQHALHERVLYERIMRDMTQHGKLVSQRLLFPVKIPRQELGALAEREDFLHSLGFELRQWDDAHWHLLSAPAILKRRYAEALQEIAEVASRGDESFLRDTVATMACHAAVRAHDALSSEEVQQLLKDFSTQDALGHCPHGRPTFVRLTLRDLEKMFHRVL